MLRLRTKPHDGGAKDGRIEMSLAMSGIVVGVERLVGSRAARSPSLAVAGAAGRHAVCQWSPHGDNLAPGRRRQQRLPGLLLLPRPRGTQERIDRHALLVLFSCDLPLPARLLLVIDDSPTRRVWAEGRRGRRPSQPDSRPRRPAISVWTHLGDDLVGPAASPVGPAGVAAAGHAVRPQALDGDDSQVSPLALPHQAAVGGAAGGVDRAAREKSGENGLDRRRWRLYQAALLEACLFAGVVVVGRLRKDAALRDLPPRPRANGRGRPRKYGKNKISLAKRAGQKRGWHTVECTSTASTRSKTQDLPGDLRPAGGVIRVVLVKEDHGWFALF